MIQPARRLDSVQEYYFATKLREVRAMMQQGDAVINAGIGSPDLQPPPAVVDAIKDAQHHKNAHAYQSYIGMPELRAAMGQFYNDQYGVHLDPDCEIIPLMGSKEAIMLISLAFLNAGDGVLVPDPGYPTYTSVSKLCEANIMNYDLTEDNNWMPDFAAIEKNNLSGVKIMWVNYPHMPTGASGNRKVFEQLIQFGRKHEILIINDNPYSTIGYEDAMSIHQICTTSDFILELNSLSKAFNMAGWRVGMLTGNAEVIKQVLKVKTNMDSGMFYGIQMGAIAALQTSQEWIAEQNDIYQERRKAVVELAKSLNLKPTDSNGGLFVWCKLPDGQHDDKNYVDSLLKEHHIFIAPGSIFGENGAGYVRFSLCLELDKIAEMKSRVTQTAES